MTGVVPYANYNNAERDCDYLAQSSDGRWVVLEDMSEGEFLVMRESSAEELMSQCVGRFEVQYSTGVA